MCISAHVPKPWKTWLHAVAHKRTLSLSLSLMRMHTVAQKLSLTPTHAHCGTCMFALSHMHTHYGTQAFSLSSACTLRHTSIFTLSLSHTLALTFTLARWIISKFLQLFTYSLHSWKPKAEERMWCLSSPSECTTLSQSSQGPKFRPLLFLKIVCWKKQ